MVLACLVISIEYIGCKKTVSSPAPVADFSYGFIQTGILPAKVEFTSKSSNAVSFYWDFGDNTTSSTPNPTHSYNAAKAYAVKLVVTNSAGKDSVTKEVVITLNKPKPDFTFTIRNSGSLPDTVDFTNATTNASSAKWFFGDGDTSSAFNPQKTYKSADTFTVKLIAANVAGSDSITKQVIIALNKPTASFGFTTTSQESLPVLATFTNNSTGSAIQYHWYFGDTDTSSEKAPNHNYTSGGIYNIKLVATNAAGSDSSIQQLKISPYLQAYTSINGIALNLYAWKGNKVMILSRNKDLNRATMYKWLPVVDSTYNYYKACTGKEPQQFAPTYIDNHTTIADVPATCGAGCGYVGYTGFEMQNDFFDQNYSAINTNNQFDHLCFYECGRNFWFYEKQLSYKPPGFPVAGAYAVFMSYMARDATGIKPAPFAGMSYPELVEQLIGLIDIYLADTSLNWSNTLAIDQGVPGTDTNAAGLFCSFLYRLRRDYGGENFVQNVWKQAGLRPNAATTQDAVDNFFLASCAAANKNLTYLFQSWRWPISENAKGEASKYP